LTKKIDGVMDVTVGFDWVTLTYEDGRELTIDKMKVINLPYNQLKKEMSQEPNEM
jgi:hypothetical protein